MKLRFLDYRFASAVLEHKNFKAAKAELLSILKQMDVPLLSPDKVKRRQRKPVGDDSRPRFFFLPVDQRELNRRLDEAFAAAGWERQPLIVPKEKDFGSLHTGLRADYKKARIEVEVQLGNMARWYTDVFKFQLGYSLGEVDVAVLAVPTQHFANMIDENIAYFERVERELPHARMSLTLPILVIGMEPGDYEPVRARYVRGAIAFRTAQAAKGEDIAVIPFDHRIKMKPEQD